MSDIQTENSPTQTADPGSSENTEQAKKKKTLYVGISFFKLQKI